MERKNEKRGKEGECVCLCVNGNEKWNGSRERGRLSYLPSSENDLRSRFSQNTRHHCLKYKILGEEEN